jgi:hypothetical protein
MNKKKRMTCSTSPSGNCLSFWDSKPVGHSIHLYLCQDERLSPQSILDDKVFHSAIHLQSNATFRSEIQFWEHFYLMMNHNV